MRRLNFILFTTVFLMACQTSDNSLEEPNTVKLIGNKKILNDIIGETEGIYGGGKYSFSLNDLGVYSENTIISVRSKWSSIAGKQKSDSVPVIQISAKGSQKYQKDSTIAYTIGNENEFAIQNWRLPSLPAYLTDISVNITIPSDKQLEISAFDEKYYNSIISSTSRIRLNAHGSPMTGKFNTYEGFEGAAKAGYPCCVAVPKRTKDGVWVCFHDDDNINGLRYSNAKVEVCKRKIENGDTIYTQYDEAGKVIGDAPMPVSQVTWEFIKDKIIFNNAYYYIWGEQYVPKLEEFFDVCSKTGMMPMLSVHPALTASDWAEIKSLAQKYNVLDKLDVKLRPGDDYVDPAYQVFGDEVQRYSIYVYSEEGCLWALNKLNTLGSKGYITPCIEMLYSIANREMAEIILRNGYSCSIFDSSRSLTGERLKEMMSWGVTEFTSNYHHSYGLNW